jgi:ribonuclease HII
LRMARFMSELSTNSSSTERGLVGPGLEFEQTLWAKGLTAVAGVDEAGRGPLAGPVVAAAVIVQPGVRIEGIDDSKKLSAARREDLYQKICERSSSVGVGVVSSEEIDRTNILVATMRAMRDAVASLTLRPQHVLIDGNRCPDLDVPADAVVDGDARCFSIAAASIIAKVTRDRMMIAYDHEYPGYGFAVHKGYGTRAHRLAIAALGVCPIHRRSFSWSIPEEIREKGA